MIKLSKFVVKCCICIYQLHMSLLRFSAASQQCGESDGW